MRDLLLKILKIIKQLSNSVDNYKQDTIIQSLPAVALVNQAKKHYEKGEYLEAKIILDKAMQMPQKDARVLKYQGMVSEKLGQMEEAVNYYQNSADLNPDDKFIWQKLGFALIAVNKYSEAEKSFENADKIFHGNTDTLTGWGMTLMKQQRYAEAREKFCLAAKINRYNFSAIFLSAVMDIRLNDLDKAETRLAFLANVNPNESNTYEYAHLKFIKKDYDNALFYAEKSLEYNSNMLPAYILISNIHTINGDCENALKSLQTAEQKELISMPLYFEWGLTLIKFERYEEAEEKLNKALELMPDDKEVLANLAFCKAMKGDFITAESLINLVPDLYISRQTKAILTLFNNSTEEALLMFEELRKENNDNPVNYYFLAKCYEISDNDEKVQTSYKTALEKNPAYLNAYMDYARYLFEKKDYAEAQRKLRKALKFDENNSEILNLLFYCGYKLVKENVCQYNIKETVEIAEKAELSGDFKYPEEKSELSELLNKIQGNNLNCAR